MLESVDYISQKDIDGVKLQLLHVLKNTDLAPLFERGELDIMSLQEYIELLVECIEKLPPGLVIHRLTGDGPKSLLLAPLWSANKREVLNTMQRVFREKDVRQGKYYVRKKEQDGS